MSELDERVLEVQKAYEEAVRTGTIDPKRIDIERYADILAEDIEYFDTPSKDLSQEEKNSEQAVAKLQSRSSKLRQSILEKWFGKNDSD